MEVFSIFATLSLTDLFSGPLGKAKGAMDVMGAATASLGERMGSLAMSMAPVALAAGVLLGALGLAASKAIAFESAMADVAKVVNFESQPEFEAMSKTIMDMSGRIPMAAEGIAAIISAAAQSGIAKQDLAEFAEQAAKMGVAFDLTGDQSGKMMADWRAGMNLALPQVYALADAVNHLSNNMNATAPALGEVIQRVGAAAMACGLAETEVAALGTAFLSAGASPEIASTALKKFTTTLVKGAAMSKDAQEAFKGLGFSATQMAKDMQTDAQGTIFKVLQALADKPAELRMSLLTEMFGEEAIGAIAPLLQNMGNLTKAFELVGDKAAYAGSMQAEYDARSKTTQNALQLLSNKLTNLAVVVGNVFLPVIAAGANAFGVVADALRGILETPLGQWLVAAAGGLAGAVLAVTAFSAGLWAVTRVAPMVVKALAPIKAALLGLGWPVWALLAAVGALYLAWRNNFGGMADSLSSWWNKITLAVRGVLAVFASLKDGSGAIRGELAKEIKAAGLVGLVQTVSRVVYRVRAVFTGFYDSLSASFGRIVEIFQPLRASVAPMMEKLGALFGVFKGDEVTSATASWKAFGATLGDLVGGVLEGVACAMAVVVDGIGLFVSVIGYALDWVAALCSGLFTLTGAATAANESADPTSWGAIGRMLGVILATVVGMKGALLAWRGVMLATAVVTKAWTAAQWLLNAALRANPIGLVITAVMALAAGAGWLISNWAKVRAWWQGVWGNIGTVARETWAGIADRIAQALGTVVSSITGFGASLLSGLQSTWDAVGQVASNAWAGVVSLVSSALGTIISSVTGFGLSLLSGLQSAWDAAGQMASNAWAGMIGLISSGLGTIVSSVTGFGATLLAGVQEAWNSVFDFLSGLNLFDSGAKLLSTFVDGVKSMASSVVDGVSSVLSTVREYLPFSDAKTGPLSTLTLSGARMMETLAQGVGSGKEGLVAGVAGALASVSGKIQDFRNGLGASTELAAPVMPTVPLFATSQPEVAPQAIQASSVPSMPMLEIGAPVMPALPRMEVDAPAIAPLELRAGTIPEVRIPETPTFPESSVKNGSNPNRQAGGRTVNIYGEIHLHGVQNPQELWDGLAAEIAMTEGATA